MHLKQFQCGKNVCPGIDSVNKKLWQNFTLAKSLLKFESH